MLFLCVSASVSLQVELLGHRVCSLKKKVLIDINMAYDASMIFCVVMLVFRFFQLIIR